MGRIHPITLENGRILLPLYNDGFNFSMVAISDDDGTTWRQAFLLLVAALFNLHLQSKRMEISWLICATAVTHRTVFTPVFQLIKVNRGSVSTKTDIPNEASVEICVMKDRKWAFVGNDINDGRYQLSIYISGDEGSTWKWKELIEYQPDKKGNFSYPCLIQTSDGMLHLSYSYSLGEGKKTIKHTVIDPKKLIANNWAEKLGFPEGRKVLLLHIDDAGMCPEANAATQKYIGKGQYHSAAVMMPCPNAEAFIKWAKKYPQADIGVHLT